MRYIDLNNETHRQIVVDREAGVYLGHVSSVLLEDNRTILALYPSGHGNGRIIQKKSYDGGLTWSERMVLPESFKTSLEVPTVFRLKDPTGAERLVLFSGHFPIRTAHSEDEGATWSELEPLDDYGAMVAMGDVVALDKPGKYMALFHDEINVFYGGDRSEKLKFYRYTDESGNTKYTRVAYKKQDDGSFLPVETVFVDGDPSVPEENGVKLYETTFGHVDAGTHFHVNKILTKNGGKTWSQPQTIARHPAAHLCEPGAIRLLDGRIAILLRENSRTLPSQIIFSDDEGETFSKPVPLPDVLTGDRHTCRRLNDGRIAITFRDMGFHSATRGDWVLWIGTDDDLLHQTEGEYKIRLKDNHPRCPDDTWPVDCAYPGMHVLPDGTIVTLTYGHWTAYEDDPAVKSGLAPDAKPYILCVRLHPDELDGKA